MPASATCRLVLPLTVLTAGLLLSGCQSRPTPPPAAEPATEISALKAQVDALQFHWPKLERYAAANAALPPLAPGEQRVVFLGDSITDGWPGTDGFFAAHHYVGRGISGQATAHMLLRFRQDVVALRPALVVILAGTNDVADNAGPYDPEFTHGNLTSLVQLARANGIKVVLCSVLPATDFWWRHGLDPAPKIVALNTWIRDFAAHESIPYVDYHTAMADAQQGLPKQYAGDGVHPNAAGYAVMESLVQPAIEATLARK
jgi:acyl-CoA thioesterase I